MRKIIIYLFLSIILAGCQTTNPRSDAADQEFVRLDTEGYLYYMDYT
ncbi:MAG: membrane lipoprotein lipid attachment site-containing protein [Spirochaetales bacterium]|nr:membrane lipoprotein lipid attachment site-containing protein [Spirochaetales bacterium]